MNKLLVVENKMVVNKGNYKLDYENACGLSIKDKVYLNNLAYNNQNIKIELEDYAKLVFDKVNVLGEDLAIDLILNNEAYLEFNLIIINKGRNQVKINIVLKGNSNKALIKLRAINKNKDSNLNIICNGKVLAKTKDNELLEDLKGLLINNSTIKISPNMAIDTNEVMANHQVTIGPLKKEDIFYLKTRGLSEEAAKRMLIEAFSTSIINEELKEKIKMEVKECE